jgi:hypothetical protein
MQITLVLLLRASHRRMRDRPVVVLHHGHRSRLRQRPLPDDVDRPVLGDPDGAGLRAVGLHQLRGGLRVEMGIGKPPEHRPLLETPDILVFAWGATVPMIAYAPSRSRAAQREPQPGRRWPDHQRLRRQGRRSGGHRGPRPLRWHGRRPRTLPTWSLPSTSTMTAPVHTLLSSRQRSPLPTRPRRRPGDAIVLRPQPPAHHRKEPPRRRRRRCRPRSPRHRKCARSLRGRNLR